MWSRPRISDMWSKRLARAPWLLRAALLAAVVLLLVGLISSIAVMMNAGGMVQRSGVAGPLHGQNLPAILRDVFVGISFHWNRQKLPHLQLVSGQSTLLTDRKARLL